MASRRAGPRLVQHPRCLAFRVLDRQQVREPRLGLGEVLVGPGAEGAPLLRNAHRPDPHLSHPRPVARLRGEGRDVDPVGRGRGSAEALDRIDHRGKPAPSRHSGSGECPIAGRSSARALRS